MDYLKFFGLDQDPFRFTPDPDFFYRSEGHDNLLLSLDHMVDRGNGFMIITGEHGVGKTAALRVFIEKYRDECEIALITTQCLSPEKLLLAILDELEVPQPGGGKGEMIKAFRDFLLFSAAQGKKAVIVLDGALQLSDETLEELWLLSDMESESGKPVRVVLAGQTDLITMQQLDRLRRPGHRVEVRAELQPFTGIETSNYIDFRLNRCGNGMTVFDDQAKQAIHKLTGGIPRTINMLASRALMSAFIEESRIVGEPHVSQAASHVFYTPPGRGLPACLDPLLRLIGVSVESKPVIVEHNLKTPRPVLPASRLRSKVAAAAAAGAIVVCAMYLFYPRLKAVPGSAPSSSQIPAAATLAHQRPGYKAFPSAAGTGKKAAVPLSGPLRDLPEFIPPVAPDRSYGASNPGWELYRGKVTEFRVLREKGGFIKGIQVLDRGGAGIDEEFMRRALRQAAGTPSFRIESSERKEGYRIERGRVGDTVQAVRYRDEGGGRLRAFVLRWP